MNTATPHQRIDINPPKMTEHPFVYWGTLKATPHESHQLATTAALSPEAEETAGRLERWAPGFQDCEGQAGAFANLSSSRISSRFTGSIRSISYTSHTKVL